MVGHTKISTLRRQPRQKEHYKIGASLGYVEYKACPDYRVKPCLKKKKKKKKKKRTGHGRRRQKDQEFTSSSATFQV